MNVKRILIILLGLLVLLSTSAVVYRYGVRADFTYEAKPLEEFTEDDL